MPIGIYEKDDIDAVAKSLRDCLGVEDKFTPKQMGEGVRQVASHAHEAGRKSQYDEFWDFVQAEGKRVEYTNAFYYWSSEYIRPTHKVVPTSALNSMFAGNKKLKVIEKEYFDFSQITNKKAEYMCNVCERLLVFEDCGIPALESYSRAWRGCTKLHTIEVVRSDENTLYALTFESCHDLENLTIEGTIGQNDFNVQWSTKLSKASITSIINALSTTTSGLTVTLSKTAVNNAFEGGSTGEEWLALVATKSNWNISLV